MRFARTYVLAFLSLLFALTVFGLQTATTLAQSPPQRDPQALGLLSHSLSAAGGASAIAAVQDFTGTGSITYFWAGQAVQGSVTLRGRGNNQFRLDATLPQGTRSWAVTDGQGSVKETNGQISKIVYENAMNLGALSLPYLELLAALNDSSFAVSFLGQMTVEGMSVYDVRIQKIFTTDDDPTGDLAKAC